MTAEPIEPDDPNGESRPARSIEPILPAHPLAVALSARAEVGLTLSALTQRLWWPDDGEEIRPVTWTVSADVSDLEICSPEARHVGDISVAVVDLTRPFDVIDAPEVGGWVEEFVTAVVDEPVSGRLHPDLEATIPAGPARLVVLGQVHITKPYLDHMWPDRFPEDT